MFNERKQMTGQANVNAKKLKALPISLPSLPEQRRIVAHLDALQCKIDTLKRHQAETAAELDALRQDLAASKEAAAAARRAPLRFRESAG